jgi:D,D-heptose 1,7-bisphosphate phosphatase
MENSQRVTRQAVILVGGRGSRLGALTYDCPKPLLEVGGYPFLSYLIASLARQGFDDVLLLAGYQSDSVLSFADAASRDGLSVRCVVEKSPLGTGGALINAIEYLADQFILVNGDTLFDINLNDFASPCMPDCLARMALRWVENTDRYGCIVLEDSNILEMKEKGIPAAGLINAGIYFLAKCSLNLLPQGISSIEKDLIPQLIAKRCIEGREYSGFFLDIGVPVDFKAAQSAVPKNQSRPSVFLHRDVVLNEDRNYVDRPDQIYWISGAKEAIKYFNDAGCYVFVVSHQAGVARGFYAATHVKLLHDWMQQELRAVGAHVDAFYCCPHHPEFNGPCDCRKPEPGVIFEAMREWPVIKIESFLIGDKDWYIRAANNAGIDGYLFQGGNLLEFVLNLPV